MTEGLPKKPSSGKEKDFSFKKHSIVPAQIGHSMPRYYTKGFVTLDRNTDSDGEEIPAVVEAQNAGRTLTEYLNFFGISKRSLYGKTILDFGAGRAALPAVELKDKATVISLSPDYADERHRVGLSEERVMRVAAVGHALPFPDETFNVVLALNVFDHIGRWEPGGEEAFAKSLREIIRVLKEGGTAYIGPVNNDWMMYREVLGGSSEAHAQVDFKIEDTDMTATERDYDQGGSYEVRLQRAKITKRKSK